MYVVGLTGAIGRPPVSGSSLLLCGSGSCRTVLAVAGKDFCVVASDTRLGLGYSIPSRKVSRILKMYVFFASYGLWFACEGSCSMVSCSAALLPMLSGFGSSLCDLCIGLRVIFFHGFVFFFVIGRTRSC